MTENPLQPKGTGENETPLESWKEISAYLKRDVSTVKRWEKSEDLPVHRHLHQARSSVYAYPSELDAWRAQRRPAEEAAALGWLERGPVRALAFTMMLLLTLMLAGGGMVLSPLTSAAQGPEIVVKRVWSGPGVDTMGSPSPDGRYLSFVDWSTGDLAVRDLTTGENRRLTNKGSWADSDEYAEFSVISPDSNQLAYAWFNTKFYELRVVGMDGKNPRVLYSNKEVQYVQPVGWTPDGRHIVAIFSLLDRTNRFVTVNVADGTARVLKTFDWRYPQGRLSPDGRWLAYSFPPAEDAPERDIFVLALDGTREVPLVKHPAHDFLLGWSPDGDQILFGSDRTGSIAAWSQRVAEGRPEGDPRIVRQDLGRVIPIGLTRAGALYYATQTLRDVYEAELDVPAGRVTSEPRIVAHRFQGSNFGPAWSPDGKYLAYFSSRSAVPAGVGSRTIVIQSAESGAERELRPSLNIARHPVFSRPDWSRDGKLLYLIAQDARGRRGYYRVDAQTGQHELVFAVDPPGHVPRVDLAGDGSSALIKRQHPEELPALLVRNLATGTERVLHRAPHIHAWALSPDGKQVAYTTVSEEDAKASGRQVANSNRLVIQPIDGGSLRELFRVPPEQEIVSVRWTADQRHLLFHISADPGSEEQQPEAERRKVWRIPVAGGQPELTRISLLPRELQGASFQTNGRHLAYTVLSEASNEIWVMENFLPALKAAK